jgi:alpha-L-fucosidase
MVWDIERGQSNAIEPLPWQTDTCIGGWHYQQSIFTDHKYKSAKIVIHTLVDVVSKNGNLCLSVPVKGDGTIDNDERKIVEGIGKWMAVNNDCIYDTRPWKIFGEGPALEKVAALSAQGFNEGKGKPFPHEDIRFTTKGNTLYAIAMGWPESKQLLIKSIVSNPPSVELLGHGKVDFKASAEGLKVNLPSQQPCESAFVLKIEGLNI